MAHRTFPDSKVALAGATLLAVAGEKRRQDKGLARYYAYRIKVWKALDEKHTQQRFADLTGLHRAEVSQLANGKTASLKLLEAVARFLGPPSEEEFKQLARAWAEENPSWEPDQPLPKRITHTGGPLEDGSEGGLPVFSDDLREAARAIVGTMKCKPEHARAAAEIALQRHLAHSPDHETDWLYWLQQMKPIVAQLMKGSGERPSARVKAAKS